MITTTYGDMDESLLVKTTGEIDNQTELTAWVEYRLPESDEVIHRSVNMQLKKSVFAAAEAASF